MALALGAGLLGVVTSVLVMIARPALDGDFLAEDFGLIRLWRHKPFGEFWRLRDISEGIWGIPAYEWRPLWAFTYRVDGVLFGSDTVGPHATNLVIHTANALLVSLIVIAVMPSARLAGLAAGCLFLVAPVHSEAISWITGRVDSFSTLFYLASFLCFVLFRRRAQWPWFVISLLSMALGLLAKETLLTLPLAICAFDVTLRGSRAASAPRPRPLGMWIAWIPYFAMAAGYAGLRLATFGTGGRESRFGVRALARFWAEEYRLQYLLTPFEGVAGWPGRTPQGPGGVGDPQTGLVLGVVFALLFLLVRDRHRLRDAVAAVVFFGLAWHVLTLLPLVATYPGARHLYLPGAGVAMALGLALLPPGAHRATLTPVRLCAAVGLFVLYGVTLAGYNREWSEAGEVSRRIRVKLEDLAKQVPPGSVVVLPRLPGSGNYDRIRVWRWALPYALQPPATVVDVYSRLRILEPPDLFCCPLRQWSEAKKPILSELLGQGRTEAIRVYALTWRAGLGDLVCSSAAIRTELLESTVRDLDLAATEPRRAEQLVERLRRAVERGPGAPCPPGAGHHVGI